MFMQSSVYHRLYHMIVFFAKKFSFVDSFAWNVKTLRIEYSIQTNKSEFDADDLVLKLNTSPNCLDKVLN